MNKSEIQIFTTKDGKTEIEVQLDNETVWLNQISLNLYLKQTELR